MSSQIKSSCLYWLNNNILKNKPQVQLTDVLSLYKKKKNDIIYINAYVYHLKLTNYTKWV